MKISSFCLFLAALVSTSVNAAPYNEVPFPKNVVTTKTWTYSTKKCSTSLGPKTCNGKVKTSAVTKKQTTRPTVYKTVTPTQYVTGTTTVTVKSTRTIKFTNTVTPAAQTVTRYTTFDETASFTDTSFTTFDETTSFTETSYTTLDETTSFSETTTLPSTTTVYDEVVETVTETANVPRETVPVPPGFKYPTPGTRTPRRMKRAADGPTVEADDDISVSRDGNYIFNKHAEDTSPALEARTNKKYPQKVVCTVYLGVIIPKTSTRTAKTKTVIKATKTTTKVSSVTISRTDTITLAPLTVTRVSSITETDSTTVTEVSSITETESTTTTELSSSTETESVTTTITEYSAVPTVSTTTRTVTETVSPRPTYAACNSRNIVSRGGSDIGNRYLVWLSFGLGPGGNPGEGATSPEECCQRCWETTNCSGAMWRYSSGQQRWLCQVSTGYSDQQCAGQNLQAGAYRARDEDVLDTYVINGKCGTWDYF